MADSIYPAIIDTIQDDRNKKEIRKEKQRLKIENSGKFFSHNVKPGKKAALYSLALPGLGQVYNRKFWKLPIVYGAIGTTLYFTISNTRELKRYNTALNLELKGEPHEFGDATETQITLIRNAYRKNTELSSLLTALFHGLTIIDATVDAHLFKFDISDDLALEWHPNFLTGNNSVIPSIQLSLHFK